MISVIAILLVTIGGYTEKQDFLTCLRHHSNSGQLLQEIVMTTKKCTKCGKVKPLSAYSKTTNHGKPGIKARCKSCVSAEYKTWHARQPPEYKIWRGIKQRCTDSGCSCYKYYGARGISVSPLWVSSFRAFLSDMGPRPTSSHQIDRIDNDGDYTPENCRWVTRTENIRNCSQTKLSEDDVRVIKTLIHDGSMKQWDIADIFGVNQVTISDIKVGNTWKEVLKGESHGVD